MRVGGGDRVVTVKEALPKTGGDQVIIFNALWNVVVLLGGEVFLCQIRFMSYY